MSGEPWSIPKLGWDQLARMPTLLETGDVIHVRGEGLLSRLIRWSSQAIGEPPTWASHSALVLKVTDRIEIIEALTKVTKRPLSAYSRKTSKVLVSRIPGGLTDEQKDQVMAKAEDYHGRTYGYFKLLVHALDRLFNNQYVFRRLLWMDNYPICSWLVAYVYDRALHYRFRVAPNGAQPDDILDHCAKTNWGFVWSDSKESVDSFLRIYKSQEGSENIDSTSARVKTAG